MQVIRATARPTVVRRAPLPTLQRLVDGDVGACATTILVNQFIAGQRVPDHKHDVEEVIVVTAGQCVVSVADAEGVLATGDAVVVPPGTAHSIRHVGDLPATVIAVLATAHAVLPTPHD
jgi:quercetin dioxygenase-like cupin family protein